MKTKMNFLLFVGSLILINCSNVFSQGDFKPTCAVLNVEATKSIRAKMQGLDNVSAGTMVRRELEKLSIYQVSYRQDMERVVSNAKLDECFDITCLVETGEALNVNRVVSGAIEYLEGSIIISIREVDVASKRVSNSISREFRFLPEQLRMMVEITLRQMYNLPFDEVVNSRLTQQFTRDDVINNPGINRLNLSGFRVGVVSLLGENRSIMKAPRSQGGFDSPAVLFQFGYQFETQYLNQGRLQALFEFVPMITGVEQGLFIPSLTVMHGVRDNKTGLEFAFGPNFTLGQVASGYINDNGEWILEKTWRDLNLNEPEPEFYRRMDSRGFYNINVGVVLAAGFSLKSGSLNVPINAFTVMHRKSFRVGLSVGINGKGR
jgi:hypothetical protein